MSSRKSPNQVKAVPWLLLSGTVILCILAFAGCTETWDGKEGKRRVERPAAESIVLKQEKGPVELQVRLWPKAPRLSDLVELEIEVGGEADVVIRPPAFGDAVGDFLVRDYSERPPQKGDEKSKPNRRVFYYQLEPVFTGPHLIRSVAIEFVDNRDGAENKGESTWIESEPIEVKVVSELAEQVPSLSNLEPMVSPIAIQDTTAWWWLAGGFFIALAIAAYFLRRGTKAGAKVEHLPSPEEIAHSQLASLLAEDLPSQGMFKDFYLRLTGIVRNYIEGITSLRAPEQTTEEFLREIGQKEVFSQEQSKGLKEFLEAADMVKCAAQKPDSNQVESSIRRAKEFIDMKPMTSSNSEAGKGA